MGPPTTVCKKRKRRADAAIQYPFDPAAVSTVSDFADDGNFIAGTDDGADVLQGIAYYTISRVFQPTTKATLTGSIFVVGIDYGYAFLAA
jgi:hypothetical protein